VPAPLPRGTIGFARRPAAVKAVGSFLPGLTAKAFQKFGFTTAQLVMDWATIVGRDLAGVSVPERLKWPPRPANADAVDGGRPERRGATLVLRVDGARALDIHYKSRQLLERVNAYFGYAAVTELRLLQAPLPARLPPGPARDPASTRQAAAATVEPRVQALAPPGTQSGAEIGAGISDAALRRALARLAAHVHTGR
jgi:hypothetical protein